MTLNEALIAAREGRAIRSPSGYDLKMVDNSLAGVNVDGTSGPVSLSPSDITSDKWQVSPNAEAIAQTDSDVAAIADQLAALGVRDIEVRRYLPQSNPKPRAYVITGVWWPE
jgi:hypothetical protein